MDLLLLGFFTGLSLILAIGAQNIFVIEQGLKKQYVFLICLICSLSMPTVLNTNLDDAACSIFLFILIYSQLQFRFKIQDY